VEARAHSLRSGRAKNLACAGSTIPARMYFQWHSCKRTGGDARASIICPDSVPLPHLYRH